MTSRSHQCSVLGSGNPKTEPALSLATNLDTRRLQRAGMVQDGRMLKVAPLE